MADSSDSSATPKKTVTVDADHYRSLILSKLRADIAASRAALQTAAVIDASELQDMGYWKMHYYKMNYWKMGHVLPMENEASSGTSDDAGPKKG